MSDPKMDLERLGALIDGRLDPEARTAALRRLAEAEDERLVFADTAAVLRALEEEDAAPAEPPSVGPRPAHGARSARRLPPWAAGLMAAGIVLAVALTMTMAQRSARLPSPEETLAAVTARGQALPPDWSNAWGPARGGGTVEDTDAVAARLGVTHLHLLVAVAAHDAPAKAQAIAEAKELLERWNVVADSYQKLSRPDVTPAQVAETGDEAAEVVGVDRFRLGAWAEAARLAASRGDEGFFRSRASRSALGRAERLFGRRDPAFAASEVLRTLLASGKPLVWPDVQEAARQLVVAITSGPRS